MITMSAFNSLVILMISFKPIFWYQWSTSQYRIISGVDKTFFERWQPFQKASDRTPIKKHLSVAFEVEERLKQTCSKQYEIFARNLRSILLVKISFEACSEDTVCTRRSRPDTVAFQWDISCKDFVLRVVNFFNWELFNVLLERDSNFVLLGPASAYIPFELTSKLGFSAAIRC